MKNCQEIAVTSYASSHDALCTNHSPSSLGEESQHVLCRLLLRPERYPQNFLYLGQIIVNRVLLV